MAAQNVVRRVSVEGKSTGLDKVARDLRDVGQSAQAATDGLSGVAKVSDTVVRRQISTADAVDRLSRRLDDGARAANEMAKGQRLLDRAIEQAVIDVQTYDQLLGQLRGKYDTDARAAAALRAQIDPVGAAQARLNAELTQYQGLAARGAIQAHELAQAQDLARHKFDEVTEAIRRQKGIVGANDNAARFRKQNLTYQLFDVGQMAALGQNPMMTLMQQGPQIAQIYAGQGGVNAAFKDLSSILGTVAKRFGPIAVAVGVAAGAVFGLQQAIQDATGQAVSFGDTLKAVFQVVGGYIYDEIKPAVEGIGPYFEDAWKQAKILSADAFDFIAANVVAILQVVGAGARSIGEAFSAAFDVVKIVWGNLPKAMGDMTIQAAQAVVDGTETMINKAIGLINSLIDAANIALTALGSEGIKTLKDVKFEDIINPWKGQAAETADAIKKRFADAAATIGKAFEDANKRAGDAFKADYATTFFGDVAQQSVKNMQERLRDLKKEAKDAKAAAAELKRQFDAFEGRADNLLEKYFPGEAARREAHELMDLLDRFGGKLDDMQRKAVETRIDEMFVAASVGLRDLDGEARKGSKHIDEMTRAAKRLEDALRDAASNFLQDLFTGKDLLESIVQLGSRFASMNFDKFTEGFSNWMSGKGFTFDTSDAKASAKVMGREIGAAIAPVVRDVANDNRPSAVLAGSVGSYTSAITAGKAMASSISPELSKSLSPMAASITKAAQQLGISSRDLATVISYETGGTFSTSIWGGKNKDYLGLIQFGPEERQKYGAYWGQAFEDQMQAAVRYFKDRGLKPGSGLADLYSTILTGSPGNYNRSDGYGTVLDHIAKMGAHAEKADKVLAGAPDAIRSASETGTKVGSAKGVENGVISISGNKSAGAASSGGLQGAVGLIGAGLGGFSTGYQSANPGLGALGGGLQGWGAGASIASTLGMTSIALPVIGAIVGAVGGLIGGILGSRKKIKEARRELEKNMNAINNLLDIGFGKGMGAFQKRLSDYLAEVDKGVDLAWKARNMDLVHTLQESWNSMFWRLRKDFYDIFDETAAGYSSGLGLEAPALKGAKAISDLREELRAWIADVEYFGKKAMENDQKVVDAGGEPSPAYYEQMKLLEKTMAQANEAARQMILGFVGGADQFTEYETAVQSLKGTVDVAQTALEELGMSADDAAKAIEAKLNVALYKLRNNLSTDLTRSLNDLSDFGYLNDILDSQTAYETRVRDLKAVGLDTGMAMGELTQRLSNIAHEADLTDDQLKQLAGAFPQLSGALLSLVGSSLGTPQQALDDAKAKVEEAKDALRSAYDKEISTLQEAKSAHDNYIKSIQKFLDDLKLDDQLSPLDPTQRFQEAQKQYLETTQLALSGDKDAIEKVEDVSRQYLEEARAYYGTSEGYFSIFNDVESTLNAVLASSQKHLSELDQQLSAMEAQRDAQLGTTDAVLSVEEAINRLASATAAEAAAKAAYDAAQDAAIQQMLALLQQTGQANNYDPYISSLYRDILGRAPDAEGAAYYTAMLNSGVSQEEIRRRFVANAQPELDRGYPAFADGGYHAGGLRLVGERGPELEMTGASRIWNASDTSRILSQAWQPQNYAFANDNSAASLLKEVQALRQEVVAFREDRKEGDGIVAAGAQATVAAVSETTQSVRDQASAARRERGRRTA